MYKLLYIVHELKSEAKRPLQVQKYYLCCSFPSCMLNTDSLLKCYFARKNVFIGNCFDLTCSKFVMQ